MAIVDKIKTMIANRGGQVNGIRNIEDAVKVLGQLDEVDNPLKGLVVDVDIGAATDLLGKVVADLQKDIVVDSYRGKITGTSKYVTGYTGFSGNTNQQKGNYLALHCSVPDVEDVTIKVKLTNEVTLDPDGINIFILGDTSVQTIKVTASKTGYPSITKTFSLSELVLEPATT